MMRTARARRLARRHPRGDRDRLAHQGGGAPEPHPVGVLAADRGDRGPARRRALRPDPQADRAEPRAARPLAEDRRTRGGAAGSDRRSAPAGAPRAKARRDREPARDRHLHRAAAGPAPHRLSRSRHPPALGQPGGLLCASADPPGRHRAALRDRGASPRDGRRLRRAAPDRDGGPDPRLRGLAGDGPARAFREPGGARRRLSEGRVPGAGAGRRDLASPASGDDPAAQGRDGLDPRGTSARDRSASRSPGFPRPPPRPSFGRARSSICARRWAADGST